MPIPGTTKPHRLEENVGAAAVALSAAEVREIDEAAAKIPVTGDRYAPKQQAMINR